EVACDRLRIGVREAVGAVSERAVRDTPDEELVVPDVGEAGADFRAAQSPLAVQGGEGSMVHALEGGGCAESYVKFGCRPTPSGHVPLPKNQRVSNPPQRHPACCSPALSIGQLLPTFCARFQSAAMQNGQLALTLPIAEGNRPFAGKTEAISREPQSGDSKQPAIRCIGSPP